MLANSIFTTLKKRKSLCLRLVSFVFFCVLVAGQFASVASALTPNQKKLFDSGIFYFDASTCSTPSGSDPVSPSGQTVGPPKAVQKVVWDTLTGGGVDPMHAAAVMGNIDHEGVWDPENVEDVTGLDDNKDPTVAGNYGYGLIGWTPGQSLLDEIKVANIDGPPWTAETQAAVILAAIQGKVNPPYAPDLGQQFLNTKSIEDATAAWQGNSQTGGPYLGFERPADEAGTLDDRTASARQFLNEFGGESGSPTASPTGSCCPSGGAAGVATVSGSVSPNVGKGMSATAQQKFQQILVAAGQKFNVDPNFIASFYYAENARTGDSTNNADSASPPPVTGDGNWREPAPPYGNGDAWASNVYTASGPFQFIDSTWEAYGQDGNGDGDPDVNNLADAAFAAAKYLAASGGTSGVSDEKLKGAAFSYNHSDTYVESVMNTFKYLQNQGSASVSSVAGDCLGETSTPGTVASAVTAAKLLSSYKLGYIWGGLHGAGQLDITDPSKLQQLGADCSGSVSWVLHQAGMLGSTGGDSTAFLSWGEAGEGKEMTVWANSEHVFIEFNVSGLGHYQLNTVAPDDGESKTPGGTGVGPRFYKWGAPGGDTSGFTPRHWSGT